MAPSVLDNTTNSKFVRLRSFFIVFIVLNTTDHEHNKFILIHNIFNLCRSFFNNHVNIKKTFCFFFVILPVRQFLQKNFQYQKNNRKQIQNQKQFQFNNRFMKPFFIFKPMAYQNEKKIRSKKHGKIQLLRKKKLWSKTVEYHPRMRYLG